MTSVLTLWRFHAFEEIVDGELLSSKEAAEGDSGRIGADRKWNPRGVGKWSLWGVNH